MNHQINRLGAVMAFALVLLLANLSVPQVFQSDWLRSRPDNTRSLLEEYGRPRGDILVDGRAVADSIPTSGTLKYQRSYPNGALYAPATGFFSLVYGASGIERLYDSILNGRDDRLAVDRLQQLLAGRKPAGGSVTLTLSSKMQTAAYEALAGRTGAVVALDSQTGAILTLVSSPSFDPSVLSSNVPVNIRNEYEALSKDKAEPMLNRPLALTLPPGSTFKLVVAAAALSSGKYTADSILPGPAAIKLPGTTHQIHNWQHGPCAANSKLTLRHALEVSCNTAFAWLGMQLGADALLAQAQKFGFNSSITTPLVASTSVFPASLTDAETAMSAIGQFDVRASALQMAMVSAAIANQGHLMQPYLVKRVQSANLDTIESASSTEIDQAVTTSVAASLADMMTSVVEHGTASAGKIPGIVVGAKTGTAESGTAAAPHAWFVANATRAGRSITVAVVVENGGGAQEVSGNKIAGPIAAAVIKAAF